MLLAANSATAKPANAVALLRDAAARTAIARAAATVPINDSNFTLIHAGAAAALSVAAYEVDFSSWSAQYKALNGAPICDSHLARLSPRSFS